MSKEKTGSHRRVHYHVIRGLDIPIKGVPKKSLGPLTSKKQALYLGHIDQPIKLLVDEKTFVQKGEPLACLKEDSSICFVSPVSGSVSFVQRGEKRKLISIVVDKEEDKAIISPLSSKANPNEILEFFAQRGLFLHLEKRPFGRIPEKKAPDKIFVSLVNSDPFAPSYKQEINGFEEGFIFGLQLLAQLSQNCYIIIPRQVDFEIPPVFKQACFTGPHPSGSFSLHIQALDPIKSFKENIWTLRARDVLTIGQTTLHGAYFTKRILAVAGEGFDESVRGYYETELGCDLSSFKTDSTLVIGSVLSGRLSQDSCFIGPKDFSLVSLKKETSRKALPFLRLGLGKFTATRTYLSHFFKNKLFSFTDKANGEERAFIDGQIYQKVTPLAIEVVPLIKAVLAKNFETACELGLLGVVPEDFELPSFVCPSKIDMISIIKEGLLEYHHQLHE